MHRDHLFPFLSLILRFLGAKWDLGFVGAMQNFVERKMSLLIMMIVLQI